MKKKKYRELYKREEENKLKKIVIKEQPQKKEEIIKENKDNNLTQETQEANDNKVLFSGKGILKEIFKD